MHRVIGKNIIRGGNPLDCDARQDQKFAFHDEQAEESFFMLTYQIYGEVLNLPPSPDVTYE